MSAPSGYTALDFVGFTDKGTYSPSATYMRNDLVHYGGNIMRCLIDNTTNVTPVVGANWELWVGASANLVERVIAPLENNPADVAYGVGRQIIYDDWLWEVIAPIAVGDALVDYAVDPINANIKKSAPVETQLLAVKAEADATDNMIAPTETNASSSSAAYAVGDQLILNNVLYTVTTAITIGDALVSGTGGNIEASDNLTDQLATKADDSALATVAKTGAYFDLSGKPTLGTAAAKDSTNAVTQNSTDLVESGAVYSEVSALKQALTALTNKYTVIDVTQLPPSWNLTSLKGDDSTDNTQSFNDLIAYLSAQPRGAYHTLFFPSGIYLLSDTVTIPQYMQIIGEGDLLTSFRTTEITNNIFIGSGYNKFENFNIQNLNSNTSNNAGISITGIQCIIRDVRIYNFKRGIMLVDGAGTKINRVYIESNVSGFAGLYLKDRCISSKIEKLTVVGTNVTNGVGIYYVSGEYCMDLTFFMCETANLGYAFFLQASDTTYPGDIFITNCALDGCYNSALLANGINERGNLIFSHNWVNFHDITANRDAIDLNNCNNVLIDGNKIGSLNAGASAYLSGVNLDNCAGITIANNNMYNLRYCAIVNVASHCIIDNNILHNEDATAGTSFINATSLNRSSVINNKMWASTAYPYAALFYTSQYDIIKNNSLEATAPISYTEATCIIDDNI